MSEGPSDPISPKQTLSTLQVELIETVTTGDEWSSRSRVAIQDALDTARALGQTDWARAERDSVAPTAHSASTLPGADLRAHSRTTVQEAGGVRGAAAGAESGEAGELRLDGSDLTLGEVIGEGGMGRVVRARQSSLRRDVAVKRVRPDRLSSSANEWLLSEARVTGELEHPNVVPVHVIARDAADNPVLVMKRIDGVAWSELLEQPDHPAWASYGGDRLRRNLEVLARVCDAVNFAHSKGILHRDLKPENVMVGEFGEVYLVDWGLAVRMGPDGDGTLWGFAGSPAYMAPEMARFPEALTRRTDVYLIGATLHEVLTGRPPHGGSSVQEAMKSVVASAIPDFDDTVPAQLQAICRRALDREPERRFASALELRDALETYLQHRDSIELAESALSRLEELDAGVRDQAGGYDAAAGLELRKLGRDCRMRLQLALEGWAENPRARDGLQRALVLLLELELAAGSLGPCESLLAELFEPRPDLAERVEALRADLEEQSRAQDRLRAIERDMDSGISARQRRVLIASVGVVSVLAAGAFAVGRVTGTFEPSHESNVVFSAVLLPALCLAVWLGRHKLMATRFNRSVAWVMIAFVVFQGTNRSVGAALGMDVDHVLVVDVFLAAFAFTALAISVDIRLLRWVAVSYLLGVAAVLVPEHALAFIAISVGVGLWTVASRW